jgi:hypothetical protein
MEGMLDTAIRLPLVSHMSGQTSRCNDTEVPAAGRPAWMPDADPSMRVRAL